MMQPTVMIMMVMMIMMMMMMVMMMRRGEAEEDRMNTVLHEREATGNNSQEPSLARVLLTPYLERRGGYPAPAAQRLRRKMALPRVRWSQPPALLGPSWSFIGPLLGPCRGHQEPSKAILEGVAERAFPLGS